MIKVFAIVSAFAAFLIFAPASHDATTVPEESSATPLVSVDWALAAPWR